jgi:8-oxo-dGTP pyrophosphatase MutT (NUDIX family)
MDPPTPDGAMIRPKATGRGSDRVPPVAISPYLANLRRHVGQELLMLPAAVALVFDELDRLLVVELAGQDRWGLPGGAIEPDEHPAAAVVREAFEETGLHLEVDGIHEVYGGPEMRHTYANGDQVQYTMVAYRCRVVGGTLRVDDEEITSARFVTWDEARELNTPPWGRVVLPDAFR